MVALLGVSDAVAQATSGPSLCPARDVEVIILIEDHGAANDVAPERLAKAALTQIDARSAVSASGLLTNARLCALMRPVLAAIE